MNKNIYNIKLNDMFSKAREIPVNDSSRIIIFSDLHVGNRKSTDDFKRNSQLFLAALKDYYYKNNFTLILNGDVEELHRYTLPEVRKAWPELYGLFDEFRNDDRLIKLSGNHDSKLFNLPYEQKYKLHESLKLLYKKNNIFIFHGHQASGVYEKYNELIGLSLRVFAKPLRIRHYSVAHDKTKQFIIEKRTYDYSREKRIISVIGHTHRPLFESYSKLDTLNAEIEQLLREYSNSGRHRRKKIEQKIKGIKKEIEDHVAVTGKEQTLSSLYSSHTVVPSVFNSGCVIGKRGMTAIEINSGKISLVQWYDKKIDSRYKKDDGNVTYELGDSGYFKSIIKEDSLDYIFTKIRLLT